MAKRQRGIIENYNPRPETIDLINNVIEILNNERQYLPLTIRQVFYRLVARNEIGKTEKDYSRLCESMGKARRARMIPFSHIRDDGFSDFTWLGYESYEDLMQRLSNEAKSATLDMQQGQSHRIVVWCEAGGMRPQLQRFVDDFSVPVVSSGGFDSLTTKYEMAKNLAQCGSRVKVFHIGDYDPSGVSIFEALKEDVSAFASDLWGTSIEFIRLAVTPEQIEEMDLSTAPPKKTDKRGAFNDNRTTQCEAIPPSELKRIVRLAVSSHLDQDILLNRYDEQFKVREKATQQLLSLTFGGK